MTREYKKPRSIRRNILGLTFGRLCVVSLLGSYKNVVYYLCKCSCGNETEVRTSALINGNTRSCGCLNLDRVREVSTTHGMSKHPVYGVWRRMLQRCEDKGCADYQHYGARGITVSAEWHDFMTFFTDMGDRPEGGTLERVDNSKGYSRENVKWATRQEQMQNTRQTRNITHGGETKSISDWARQHGIKPRTLNARLNKLGYSFEDAISKPVECGKMLNGKTWKENISA